MPRRPHDDAVADAGVASSNEEMTSGRAFEHALQKTVVSGNVEPTDEQSTKLNLLQAVVS